LFKQYLKQNRHTYNTVAQELGVSRVTVANWDKGVTSPSLYYADKISKLLDVSVIVLIDNAKKLKEINNG
jgi:DNA-binding XRE family transcriptional regulator